MIHVHLDASAIASLFPEGTEARVHLHQNVMAAMVKEMALRQIQHLDANLQAEVERAVQKALVDEKLLKPSAWGRSAGLTSEFENEIRRQVAESARNVVRDEANQAIRAERDNIHERVSNALDLIAASEGGKRLRALIAEVIQQRLTGA